MRPFTPSSHAAGLLTHYPPVERWDDWTEYDPAAWPWKVTRKYMLVPTRSTSSGYKRRALHLVLSVWQLPRLSRSAWRIACLTAFWITVSDI